MSQKNDAINRDESVESKAPKSGTAPKISTAPPSSSKGESLSELAMTLEERYAAMHELHKITLDINSGLLLDDILDGIYRNFQKFIPYQRMGFSMVEHSFSGEFIVRLYWVKSTYDVIKLERGYTENVADTRLQQIVESQHPQIINDLNGYIKENPDTNESIRLLAEEGICSLLTCPLVMGGSPIGFLFFSHATPHIYHSQHIETFQQISNQLAVILEKGWLITELAEKQAEIEMRVSELKKLNDLKNTFLGMAAHDLRNPLGNIRMTGRILSMKFNDLTNEQRQRFLDEIEHQTDFMLKLLDDILDVTQMESGMFQLHPEAIDIGEIMRSAVKRHSILSEYKKTRVLLTQIKDGLIYADPIRLRQVMDNLISNAVKYSPTGSVIQVRVAQENDRWRIAVQDEGPGLSEHDQNKLFDSFVSLSSEPTAGEKSIGLGMAITHKIVKAHQGEIGMKNLSPKGAVFWVSFPATLPK